VESAELQTELTRFDRSRVADALRPYYRLSSSRAAFCILWSWAWIVATVLTVVVTGHWTAYAAALMVIPGRQVGLFFLVHEAAHQRMFRHRTASDIIVNLLAGFPIGVTVQAYRTHHLQHHRHLNTDKDPDWLQHQNDFWRWPRPATAALRLMLKSSLGGHGPLWLAVFRGLSPWSRIRVLSRFEQVAFAAFVAGLVTVLTLTSGWGYFLLLWVLPQFTLTFVLHHYRTVAEHLAVPNTHELNASRTVVSSPLERFFVAPFGVNFHVEHHLFPGVPAYHLPSVHRLLMQDEVFRQRVHLTSSYLGPRGLWSEIAQRRTRSGHATA